MWLTIKVLENTSSKGENNKAHTTNRKRFNKFFLSTVEDFVI